MFRYKSTTDRLISIYRLHALFNLVISNRRVKHQFLYVIISSIVWHSLVIVYITPRIKHTTKMFIPGILRNI